MTVVRAGDELLAELVRQNRDQVVEALDLVSIDEICDRLCLSYQGLRYHRGLPGWPDPLVGCSGAGCRWAWSQIVEWRDQCYRLPEFAEQAAA